MKRFTCNRLLIFSVLICLAISLGCEKKADPVAEAPVDDVPEKVQSISKVKRPPAGLKESDPTGYAIFQTNVSEELILKLSPKFRLFASKLKGEQSELGQLFAESVEYKGPAAFDFKAAIDGEDVSQDTPVAHVSWPIDAPATSVSADEVWAVISKAVTFEDTQFGIVSGDMLDHSDVFKMKTLFEGRFVDDKNRPYGVKAKQTIEWSPADGDDWKISKWNQDELEITSAPRTIFENITATAIPDENLRDLLSDSLHEDLILERFENATRAEDADPEHKYFSDWESSFQYPAVSVCDIDGDDWEDMFIMDRWGQSVLLRNNGDQTFEDVSESSGLKIDEFTNCALFFDIDNDGDSDVLVGRTLESSLFFRNEKGKFVPDEEINEVLSDIKFVVSGSLADINGDGLLDVYLSTYCFTAGKLSEWIPQVVRDADVISFKTKIERNHPYIDRGGPPNVVLMNKGGKLTRPRINNDLKQWRSSYQSVWYDVDSDGDPDLYICNDFSPDVFLRNDTERGSNKPKFTDFTEEVFPGGTMGFGMGANFGDYNSDGQMDLYVSNMYSKAGLRVVEKMGGEVDPRISVSAKGNFLYKNDGGKFTQVAGLEEEAQHVSKVGWSFGGQLADFNNDSKLDLYVPSGFFTAPKKIDSQVDL